MKLTMLRSTCANGRTCPTIYVTDRDTIIVQGYRVAAKDDQPALELVKMPYWLLPEAASWAGVYATDDGMLIVSGAPLDQEAREALGPVPEGEHAVEVAGSSLVEV
jgi:hypothetical protein